MTWKFKHFHIKVIQYVLLTNTTWVMVKKKKNPFFCDIIHTSNFYIIQPASKCIHSFSEKMGGWFLDSCWFFCAWSYKGHSLFDWGQQRPGWCCCLHVIFNLFAEYNHPFPVIRVCTALLPPLSPMFSGSIKFRNMSSFSRYSRKFNVEQCSNQNLYLLYVRCFHVVQLTADNLKYLLPQLLPILIPNTFSLLGTVHQN